MDKDFYATRTPSGFELTVITGMKSFCNSYGIFLPDCLDAFLILLLCYTECNLVRQLVLQGYRYDSYTNLAAIICFHPQLYLTSFIGLIRPFWNWLHVIDVHFGFVVSAISITLQ